MQIRHVIIKVDDQDKALSFYASIVGFVRRLCRFAPVLGPRVFPSLLRGR